MLSMVVLSQYDIIDIQKHNFYCFLRAILRTKEPIILENLILFLNIKTLQIHLSIFEL